MEVLSMECSPAPNGNTWRVLFGQSEASTRNPNCPCHSAGLRSELRSTASERIARNGGASAPSSTFRRPTRASTCYSSASPVRPPASSASRAYPAACDNLGGLLTP